MRAQRMLLLASLSLPVACGPGEERGAVSAEEERIPLVLTTFHPTEYLAARIGGARVRVECAAPEAADALLWDPGDEALRRMQGADLLVLFGAGMDLWREWASLSLARLVVATRPLEEHLLEFAEPLVHGHGEGQAHVHRGIDPHVWMDPERLIVAAREVHRALARTLGEEHAAPLAANLAALEADLEALRGAWEALEVPEGEFLYTNHPAYAYLADRCGWRMVDLDLDPSSVPSEAVLAVIRESLVERPGRLILWESEPAAQAAERLAELGLESVVVLPAEMLDGAQRAAGADFLALQWENVRRLEGAL